MKLDESPGIADWHVMKRYGRQTGTPMKRMNHTWQRLGWDKRKEWVRAMKDWLEGEDSKVIVSYPGIVGVHTDGTPKESADE